MRKERFIPPSTIVYKGESWNEFDHYTTYAINHINWRFLSHQGVSGQQGRKREQEASCEYALRRVFIIYGRSSTYIQSGFLTNRQVHMLLWQ